jgi:hypothetical protein
VGVAFIASGLSSVGLDIRYQTAHYLTDQNERFAHIRQATAQAILHDPGSHVVFVRYTPQHNVLNEWVYNQADIDRSRIVWARYYTEEKRQILMQYYKDRTVWILNGDTLELSRIREAAPLLSPQTRSALGP